jgi:DNA ligase-associated metallophosphoesterase
MTVSRPSSSRIGGSDLLRLRGVKLKADTSGALYWPEERLLAIADLHFEKGSSFARRGMLLPPYDTAATLDVLEDVVGRYQPHVVVALGDNFHDSEGSTRLAPIDRARIESLQRGRDWVWLVGNHDPEPARDIGGVFAHSLSIGPITFTHQPTSAADGEIAGHLHPAARISQRGRTIARRCFAADDRRIIMPAFGAYTGGLNIRDRAFAAVFETLSFTAHLLGGRRIYSFAASRCV